MEITRSSRSARIPACVARLACVATLAVGLAAATAATAEVPKIERVVSPGGIEAWLMRYDDAPLITMRLSFSGGTLQEPREKYGMASMAAYMFNEGAGPYDAAELGRRRSRIGVNLSASSGNEYFEVSFSTPSMYKDEAFELLRLAIYEPRYDAEPMARARGEYLANLESALKSPGSIMGVALRKRLYGNDHPLAADAPTLMAGFKSVDPGDIAAFRRRVLARDNLKISVAGDIDPAALAPLLDRLFGALPAKAELRPPPVPGGTVGSCEVITMNVPQAQVMFAAVTPAMTWHQRRAERVLNAILNGEGRLFQEVRVKRGLVYGVNTSFSYHGNHDVGTFSIQSGAFGAEVKDVPEALRVTMAELRRMAAEGPTEEEVATVKRAFLGSNLLGLDTGAALVDTMSSSQIEKRPITFLKDDIPEIERITRQDVWDVAKLLLNPERFTVTIIAPPTQANLCDARASKSE